MLTCLQSRSYRRLNTRQRLLTRLVACLVLLPLYRTIGREASLVWCSSEAEAREVTRRKKRRINQLTLLTGIAGFALSRVLPFAVLKASK